MTVQNGVTTAHDQTTTSSKEKTTRSKDSSKQNGEVCSDHVKVKGKENITIQPRFHAVVTVDIP